jgi:hypothetical protein
MSLWLVNDTNVPVSGAIAFRDTSACGGEGGNYRVIGWWNIQPQQRVLVDNRSLKSVGRFWYTHFHSTTFETKPQPHQYPCPPQRFDRCWLIWSSDGRRRFFKEHVVDTDNLTVHALPPSAV